MKMMCTTSVEANGYTVFRQGKVYEFEKIRNEEGKVTSYSGKHEYGTFLVSKGDPQIADNFMKKKKYDELIALHESQQQGVNYHAESDEDIDEDEDIEEIEDEEDEEDEEEEECNDTGNCRYPYCHCKLN